MIYCENIVNITLFFFTLHRFRNHFFFSPFLAMLLPQLLQFFFPILAMALPQLVCQIFFSFHFGHSTHTSHTRAVELSREISVSTLPKFNQKYEREEEKGGERKCWISAIGIPNFLCLIPLPGCECMECLKWKEKKFWQTNCGNAIAEIGKKNFVTIVAMAWRKWGWAGGEK